jgi:hypothetical protein
MLTVIMHGVDQDKALVYAAVRQGLCSTGGGDVASKARPVGYVELETLTVTRKGCCSLPAKE